MQILHTLVQKNLTGMMHSNACVLRSAEHESAHYAVFPLHSPHRKLEIPLPTFFSNAKENFLIRIFQF